MTQDTAHRIRQVWDEHEDFDKSTEFLLEMVAQICHTQGIPCQDSGDVAEALTITNYFAEKGAHGP